VGSRPQPRPAPINPCGTSAPPADAPQPHPDTSPSLDHPNDARRRGAPPPPLRVTVGSTPPAILRPLQPPGKLSRHPLNLSSPTSPPFPHRNFAAVDLLLRPILLAAGSHPPPILLPNQGYPKVRHDPLDLPSTFTLAAGDPLRRNAAAFFLSSISSTRDLIAST
jgi:hypothetical protein